MVEFTGERLLSDDGRILIGPLMMREEPMLTATITTTLSPHRL